MIFVFRTINAIKLERAHFYIIDIKSSGNQGVKISLFRLLGHEKSTWKERKNREMQFLLRICKNFGKWADSTGKFASCCRNGLTVFQYLFSNSCGRKSAIFSNFTGTVSRWALYHFPGVLVLVRNSGGKFQLTRNENYFR